MKRIIFLDIDGVITTGRSGYWMDPVCFNHLDIILKSTGAGIVISSSWRRDTIEDTVAALTDPKDPLVGSWPFPFTDKIVGVTPQNVCLNPFDNTKRGKEIQAYLADHPCDSYVIIDDVDSFLPDQHPRFVQTHDSVGLSAADARKAIDILLNSIP